MHAQYVRIWFIGGLAALVLAIPASLAALEAGPVMLTAGVGYLALAAALGMLPAFARRDWPTPLYAIAALALGVLALPFATAERPFTALFGASLLMGAAQPLTLLATSRWSAPAEPRPTTDRPALAALVAAVVMVGLAGLALIALPRGLPNAAFALILTGAAPLAAFGVLLFILPRQSSTPFPATILAWAALVFVVLATAGLAAAFAFPLALDLRGALAALATAFALGTVALIRAASKPKLLAYVLALALLATLALLLASIEASLFPLAFHAFVAMDVVFLASALSAAAPILLPGRIRRERWMRWGPALLIAALFLYTPALQLGRSATPAAIVGAIGLAVIVLGLAPLARTR